ncbi:MULTISPECIES: chemotaxis protein CheB [Pseudomonas]|uniref:protein-glutamate methylesterase n=1 Tax=Pseudomonas luteola TaxID=47886 RepID=A0A2X2BZ53_PSELU|nr:MULTISPECIES: chemotaxis protein CheB [Pseudomonas]ENA29370.1 hypothetical protein HMPREF1487_08363 [Pseudomonas sp. HPB0071]SPZ01722.1 protein-glutamate methylesterase, CheB family [Pseudomonas luteola]
MSSINNIVVITSPLPGLRALCQLASTFPSRLETCVVVMLRVATDSPVEALVTLMGRYTFLPVKVCTPGELLVAGCVYLTPPGYQVTIEPKGMIRLKRLDSARHEHASADELFTSAAKVFGPRTIGAVLSASGRDGVEGLRAIKGAGGICIVEDQRQAISSTTAIHELSACNPNYCVPVKEMGLLLAQLTTQH